jgi:hypothetical protein
MNNKLIDLTVWRGINAAIAADCGTNVNIALVVIEAPEVA